MLTVQHLVERCHFEEVHLREELVALIAVEVADLAHDAVGIEQPALRGIERQTDDRVLEDVPVSLLQLLYLPLLALCVRLVGNGGDDTDGLAAFIFGDGMVIQVVPVGFTMTRIVVVPAVAALGFLVGTVAQPLDEGAEPFAVIGMDIMIAHLDAHIIAEQGLSVQVEQPVLLEIKTHHVIAADVERHRHGLLLIKYILTAHSLHFFFSHSLISVSAPRPCKVAIPIRWCPSRSPTGCRCCRPSAESATVRSAGRVPTR